MGLLAGTEWLLAEAVAVKALVLVAADGLDVALNPAGASAGRCAVAAVGR